MSTTTNNGYHSNSAEAPAKTTTPHTQSIVKPDAVSISNRHTGPAMDMWSRMRDRWGNRLAWRYAYATPAVIATPIAETDIAPALEIVAQDVPLLAAEIRDFHDRKLLPAYRRHTDLITYEHAELESQKTQALTINAGVEADRRHWEAEREKAVAPHFSALLKIEDEILPQAHTHAASAVSKVGGAYSQENPSEDCVLRQMHRSLETIAAELRLPWAPGDLQDIAVSPMEWLSLIGVGSLLGISLGVAVHALTLFSLGKHWPVMLACALVGFTLTFAMKQAVRGAWRHVGQNYYARQSRRKWAASLGAALARTLVLLALEVCLERQGLLATMQIRNTIDALSGGSSALSVGDQIVSWVIPMVISSALMLWAGDQGYLEGRHHEVLCRLTARQDQIWREEGAARRADPDVKRALDAIAMVLEHNRRRGVLMRRMTEIAAPLDARLAEVITRQVAVPNGLSTEAKHRIQDSRDDYLGAQVEFDRLWEQARRRVEPTGTLWERFWRSIFGCHRPRYQKLQEKRIK